MERHTTITYKDVELAMTIHYPQDHRSHNESRKHPLIVICHGFVGNRIGTDRLFVKAARQLCQDGSMVVRFDYSGCGESTGDYGSNSLDTLVSQTRYILDYAMDIDSVDHSKVCLLGHSLGGTVALLTAAKDRRVKSLILWAPAIHPMNDIIRIVGREAYEEAFRTGSTFHSGYELQRSFFEGLQGADIVQNIQQVAGDVLLIHGTGDEVIPVDYTFLCQKLFWTRTNGQCDKEILFDANHTFSNGRSAQECIEKTRAWYIFADKRKEDWSHWTI